MLNNANRNKKYIVTNELGEEFLLPNYSETFRILMDDKDTIRDMLNSLLELDHDHEIVNLTYEFEKYIDVYMPGDEPMKLDVWVATKDNRFMNIELQNRHHPFLKDRMRLYNAYQTLRSKHDYNKSEQFAAFSEKEQKVRYYEVPETVSIWLCNFSILKRKKIYKDVWMLYSQYDVNHISQTATAPLPLFPKNKYIVIDLLKFAKLRKGVNTREDYWLRLLCKGPLDVPETEDPLFVNARNRLRVSNVKPELLNAIGANMYDPHEYEAILAEAELKAEARGEARGEAKGIAKGIAKGEAKANKKFAARDKKIAKFLRSIGVSAKGVSTALAIK